MTKRKSFQYQLFDSNNPKDRKFAEQISSTTMEELIDFKRTSNINTFINALQNMYDQSTAKEPNGRS